MINKNFINRLSKKRYKRLFESTGDYGWLAKHAEVKAYTIDDIRYYDNISLMQFSEMLVEGNTRKHKDDIQRELGLVVAKGITSLYSTKFQNAEEIEVLKDWRYSDLKDGLIDDVISFSPNDISLISAAAIRSVDENSKNKSRLHGILKNTSKVENAIRFSLLRGYNEAYHNFALSNPIIDFLPQKIGGSRNKEEASEEISLSANQVWSSIKLATKGGSKRSAQFHSRPTLRDYKAALALAMFKYQNAYREGKIGKASFAKQNYILLAYYYHAKKGLEAMASAMEDEANRRVVFDGPGLKQKYVTQEGDTLRKIALDFKCSIITVSENLFKKRDPNTGLKVEEILSGDWNQPLPKGIEVEIAPTEMVTENPYVVGPNYQSFTAFSEVLRGSEHLFQKNFSENMGSDRPVEKDSTFKYTGWDGKEYHYARFMPTGRPFINKFVSEVMAPAQNDPTSEMAELRNSLYREMVRDVVGLELETISEEKPEIKALIKLLVDDGASEDKILAVKGFYVKAMRAVERSMESGEARDLRSMRAAAIDAIENVWRDSKDAFYMQFKRDFSEFKHVAENFFPLAPDVIPEPKSKISPGDMNAFKFGSQSMTFYPGAIIVNALQNKDGKFNQRYIANKDAYTAHRDSYMPSDIDQDGNPRYFYKIVVEDGESLTDEDIAKVGIDTSSNENFLGSIWELMFVSRHKGKKYHLTDLIDAKAKEIRPDLSYHALLYALEKRVLGLNLESIAYSITKKYTFEEEMQVEMAQYDPTVMGDVGEMIMDNEGAGENEKERAWRIVQSGSGDALVYLNLVMRNKYFRMGRKKHSGDAKVHRWTLGGRLEDYFESASEKIESLMSVRTKEEELDRNSDEWRDLCRKKGAVLLQQFKKHYKDQFGKVYVERDAAFSVSRYIENYGMDTEEFMQKVGAFADMFESYADLEKGIREEEKIKNKEEEIAFFKKQLDEISKISVDDSDVESHQKLVAELNLAIENAEKAKKHSEGLLKRHNFDRASVALRRAFSHIGRHFARVDPVGAIRTYFDQLEEEYVATYPASKKFIVRYSEDDKSGMNAFYKNPFGNPSSPLFMTRVEMRDLLSSNFYELRSLETRKDEYLAKIKQAIIETEAAEKAREAGDDEIMKSHYRSANKYRASVMRAIEPTLMHMEREQVLSKEMISATRKIVESGYPAREFANENLKTDPGGKYHIESKPLLEAWERDFLEAFDEAKLVSESVNKKLEEFISDSMSAYDVVGDEDSSVASIGDASRMISEGPLASVLSKNDREVLLEAISDSDVFEKEYFESSESFFSHLTRLVADKKIKLENAFRLKSFVQRQGYLVSDSTKAEEKSLLAACDKFLQVVNPMLDMDPGDFSVKRYDSLIIDGEKLISRGDELESLPEDFKRTTQRSRVEKRLARIKNVVVALSGKRKYRASLDEDDAFADDVGVERYRNMIGEVSKEFEGLEKAFDEGASKYSLIKNEDDLDEAKVYMSKLDEKISKLYTTTAAIDDDIFRTYEADDERYELLTPMVESLLRREDFLRSTLNMWVDNLSIGKGTDEEAVPLSVPPRQIRDIETDYEEAKNSANDIRESLYDPRLSEELVGKRYELLRDIVRTLEALEQEAKFYDVNSITGESRREAAEDRLGDLEEEIMDLRAELEDFLSEFDVDAPKGTKAVDDESVEELPLSIKDEEVDSDEGDEEYEIDEEPDTLLDQEPVNLDEQDTIVEEVGIPDTARSVDEETEIYEHTYDSLLKRYNEIESVPNAWHKNISGYSIEDIDKIYKPYFSNGYAQAVSLLSDIKDTHSENSEEEVRLRNLELYVKGTALVLFGLLEELNRIIESKGGQKVEVAPPESEESEPEDQGEPLATEDEPVSLAIEEDDFKKKSSRALSPGSFYKVSIVKNEDFYEL